MNTPSNYTPNVTVFIVSHELIVFVNPGKKNVVAARDVCIVQVQVAKQVEFIFIVEENKWVLESVLGDDVPSFVWRVHHKLTFHCDSNGVDFLHSHLVSPKIILDISEGLDVLSFPLREDLYSWVVHQHAYESCHCDCFIEL